MTTEHLIFLSVPALRTNDVSESRTPTLFCWANQGAICELTPTFPCVTSPVQSTMLTGTIPQEHGVIANGFFYRDRREVEFWVAHNSIVDGEHVWDAMRQSHPAYTSAAWHTQNIKGASVDFIVTPSPIHEDDGGIKLWCYSKPDGMYQQILDDLGHFPLHHYWGPLANIESTRWILSAASWLIEKHAPNFHWIYIPHLDYATQKFGPNSDQARSALQELDAELAKFAERVAASSIASDAVFLVAGEYAMTEVAGAVFPNRILREADLVAVREADGSEYLDLERSKAFAMVDHQFAHVYVLDDSSDTVAKVADLFASVPGIAGVFSGSKRQEIGLDHPRSGEVVLVCDDSHWMAYYWWWQDAAAPPFARTVDIHAKPGYDPLEMFMNPATRQVSLDTTLIKGSHGVPAIGPQHQTALICSASTSAIRAGKSYRDTELKQSCLDILGE